MSVPTAEEFNNDIRYVTYSLDEKLITFAKLHVEAALEAASEKTTLLADGELTYFSKYTVKEGNHYSETEIYVSKDSILNSYPLENIK